MNKLFYAKVCVKVHSSHLFPQTSTNPVIKIYEAQIYLRPDIGQDTGHINKTLFLNQKKEDRLSYEHEHQEYKTI